MEDTLQARLADRLDADPAGRAIAFHRNRGDPSWLTFESFHGRAARAAAQLSRHGVRRGDVCVLVLPSGELAATLALGSMLAGAVPLLVAPPVLQGANSSLMQILAHTVEKARPRLVVCSETMASMRPALEARLAGTRVVFGSDGVAGTDRGPDRVADAGPGPVEPSSVASTDVAAMQLTSGTTGMPRICVWSHRSVLAALDGMAAAMALDRDDVCLNWTPLYHDMGLVNNFLLCLVHGVPLVMLDPHDFVKRPAVWLQGLSDSGATVTWSPNFGFALAAERIRDEELEGVRLGHVRAFWNAAERIHLRTFTRFHERFAPFGVHRAALKTNYGCAENVGGATFSDPEGSFPVDHVDLAAMHETGVATPLADQPASQHTAAVVGVGRPWPGMRIRVLAGDGTPLPDGRVGVIALDTPSRMECYLGDEAATAEAFEGELLRTGDLGYLRDGELFWVGRERERIAVRGKKLDPSDFESMLLAIPDLRKGCFVAFGVDDPDRGTQRVVVASEVRRSASRPPDEIVGDVRTRALLELGVHVDDVILVRSGTLTKTSSGKRRHRHFRHLYERNGLAPFAWRGPQASGGEPVPRKGARP